MTSKKKKPSAITKSKTKSAAKPTKKARKKTPARKTAQPSLFWRLSKWCLVLALWCGIFIAGILLWYAKELPDITKSAVFERRTLIVIKAADGTPLSRYGESKGQNISVSEMPDNLVHAVLATEDRRFYDHPGIDIFGITRAMSTNIIKGRFAQGGSTITQQLAKNLFLTHDRKIARKIKEALLALWLERELTKDEILSAYMNRVYLGSGTYGFDAAARLYFDKSAKDVNLLEAAILAGLLKAPSKYSPHNNPDLAKERADIVIGAMIDAGYIKKSEITPADMRLSLPNRQENNNQNIRYFTDWVLEGVDDIIGHPDIDIIIETTLDATIQDKAQKTLVNAIEKAGQDHFLTQGGIVVMRPDGAIIGMVGGYNYAESQFNRTTLAVRPSGSTFKPFVYLSALQNGWKSDDLILDAPIKNSSYKPQNFGNEYYGEVTLENALTKSMNTATVRLAETLGMGTILKTARDAGIIAPLNRDLSTALGSSGIPVLQLTTAYATLANGGLRVYPYAITRITNVEDGRVLYERKTPKSYTRMFDARQIASLSKMMENVVNNGTGRGAQLPYPASGKTGTSQDSRDAWFAGYTDKVISVVWLGNDDNSPMRGITGGGLPAQIWKNVMITANQRTAPIATFQTREEQQEDGFTNMLGRLFSGDTKITPKESSKPFSNLND